MKLFTCLLLSVAFCSLAFAQVKPTPEKSKLENFSLKTGSLIKKEFIDIGTVAKVEVRVLKITDLVANTSITGIKLQTTVYKSYGSDTKACFLDSDEIDGLLKSGNMLLGTLSGPADNYTEYIFSSRDGFQAGAYQAKREWKYFLQMDRYDSGSSVWLEKEDFQKLLDLLTQAKAKL